MTRKTTDEVLKSYSTLKVIYGSSHYDHTYRYTTDDLLGDWEKDYYGPIPNFYVGGLRNLGCLKEIEEIIVKDGALGLLRFFRTFPEVPSWLRTMFYIRNSLAGIVPVSWRNNIVVYEDHFSEAPLSRNELVIHGVLAKGVCCFENFEKSLVKCLKENEIHKVHVILRTPLKMEGYFDEDETYGINEFLNILMSKVKGSADVTFYKLDDIEKIKFSNSYYLPIDSSHVICSGLSSEITMYTKGAIRYGHVNKFERNISFNDNYGLSVVEKPSIGSHRPLIDRVESEMLTATNAYTDLDIALLLLT